MGGRLAAGSIDAGFDVRGFDIDGERAAAFEGAGGHHAGSPAEAVEACHVAVLFYIRNLSAGMPWRRRHHRLGKPRCPGSRLDHRTTRGCR